MRYLTKTLDFDSRGDSVVTLGKFDECRSHWYEKLFSAADSILVCTHRKPI